jgi:hypothetical protein
MDKDVSRVSAMVTEICLRNHLPDAFCSGSDSALWISNLEADYFCIRLPSGKGRYRSTQAKASVK